MKPQSSIVTYDYNQHKIEFDLGTNNLMVNATAMAKVFNQDVYQFLRTDSTKLFIEECLKTANLRYLAIENEADLYLAKQKSGTWMHRILALKFAAWLSPAFELWVYQTIDNLVFGTARKDKEEIRQFALRKIAIDELRSKLSSDEDFLELERLEFEQRQASYRRNKIFQQSLQELMPETKPSLA